VTFPSTEKDRVERPVGVVTGDREVQPRVVAPSLEVPATANLPPGSCMIRRGAGMLDTTFGGGQRGG